MLAIVYLILTFSLTTFTFSLGRYPFLKPNRNLVFIASGILATFSFLLLSTFGIHLSDFEIFLLLTLAVIFFKHGKKRKYLYGSLLFSKPSGGSFVTVEENLSKNTKIMKRDGKILSGINISTGEPTSDLCKYPHLTELLPQSTNIILCLGGGACAYPSYAFKSNHRQSFDIVEIDPIVITAVKKYFPLPQSKKFKLIEGNAINFLNQKGAKKYDLIFVDLGIVVSRSIPQQNKKFTDFESLNLYKRTLSPTGTLMINIITTLQESDIYMLTQVLTPYKRVFKSHLAFLENPQKDKSRLQDIIHIFSNQKISINLLRKKLKGANEDELSYSKQTFKNLLNTYRPL